MCGICGVISKEAHLDANTVSRMNLRLMHRGPDGEGEYTDPHLMMSMRRLSIIDITTGSQPLYNEDHSLILIANGEVYNYIELRAQLEKKGHQFITKSDCETILHLYEEYGLDCVQHLRGMFVFALWDTNRKRLILARDRIGEKPLYLYIKEQKLYFASEMKALLQTQEIPFELDPWAVNLFFHYQYVPEPFTPLKGVRKLPAGHLMVVDLQPWNLTEHSYWSMKDIPPLEGDPIRLIREQLEELSTLVFRSDVPIGVALSGGVDSSAIAALAMNKYPGQLQAFSLGYPGRPEYDERYSAKQLAAKFNMPFCEIEVSSQEQSEFFSDLVYWQDDPIADISGFSYYAVSRKANEMGVKVLMQGQGGDEFFWGYESDRQAVMQTTRKQQRLQNGSKSILNYIHFSPPSGLDPSTLARWAVSGLGFSGWREFQRDRQSDPEQMIFMETLPNFLSARLNMAQYYSREFQEKIERTPPESLYKHPHPWPNIPLEITRLSSQIYLLENGIAQGDRLSMANSVELRLPLVDYRLIETVIGLRQSYPDHTLPPKYWLKEAIKDLLPAELLSRPKRGFQPPAAEWHSNLFQRYGHLLEKGFLVESKILSQKGALALSRGPRPPGLSAPVSFKALVLEIWSRRMQVQSM